MIHTVTLNPALDKTAQAPNFKLDAVTRITKLRQDPGGKGINVSIVLSNLGIKSTALGFLAGFTGDEIRRQLDGFGVAHAFISLEQGFSRIDVKIKAGEETEVNGQGPDIPKDKRDLLFQKLEQLKENDTLVLAGSIPKTLPDDIYERIMARLEKNKLRIVVDAEKRLLLNVLKYHPFLIKPNQHELGDMFDVVLKTDDEVIAHAKKLQEKGARNVLISMGGDGAIFVGEDGATYKSKVPKGTLVNSVGAGDSMVAGFLTGFEESGGDFKRAFLMGVASGSASAFSEALATREEVEALLEKLS